ncbi:MAG: hypothetical protein FWB91_11350 [Defluviitaleaceae bacterium]|nr:hypothetical protein [Defluviitaleaceae bacterium]
MNHKKLADALCVPEQEIEETYISMFKADEKTRKINCRACNFDTCEQMMVAVLLDARRPKDCARHPSVVMQTTMEELQSQIQLLQTLTPLPDYIGVAFGLLESEFNEFQKIICENHVPNCSAAMATPGILTSESYKFQEIFQYHSTKLSVAAYNLRQKLVFLLQQKTKFQGGSHV